MKKLKENFCSIFKSKFHCINTFFCIRKNLYKKEKRVYEKLQRKNELDINAEHKHRKLYI